MYPELIRLGPLVISSYGLMLALAFIAGIFIATRLAEQRNIAGDSMVNLSLILMISAIVGSRLFYVLTHLEEFRGRWKYTFLPLQPDGSLGMGGLILLGGVLGGLLAGLFYLKYKKMPLWKTVDSISPALAFGIFLGRIGCFLNGCCFGLACEMPWAVSFPPTSPAGYVMGEHPLHPTQLYSAAYALLIFAVLLGLNYQKLYDGALAGSFLILYGISRFAVDFFRFYESQMQLLGLSLNQIISLGMLLGGIVIVVLRKPTAKSVERRE